MRPRKRLERAEPLANNWRLRSTPRSHRSQLMSQVRRKSVERITMDPYEIGWYIESADEEIYGPVSRKALRRFLEEKTITPNTLVRHCTQPEARPAADQPVIMEQ